MSPSSHRTTGHRRPPSSSASTAPSSSRSAVASSSSSQPQQRAIPTSIAVASMGVSGAEAQALVQHQHAAHVQAGSTAGSQASSQGRLLLDPASLQLIAQYFDRTLYGISQRMEQLNRATEIMTASQLQSGNNALQAADAEIARFHLLIQQIDELELEFEKIKRIREIIRGYRARVAEMERRFR